MSAPRIGDRIGPVDLRASAADLFRFSAVTWNAHRIHLDAEWARQEGLPGTVVQAHLHGAWFARVACSIAGPSARLRGLSWQNKAPVVADQPVQMEGEVIAVDELGDAWRVQLGLVELGPGGATAEGAATVLLPKEDR